MEQEQERDVLINKITKKIEEMRGKKTVDLPFCMFRVPRRTEKNNNEDYYEPKLISIGPYHHGKEHVQAMQDHKWRYLHDFLSRDSKEKLVELVTVMRTLVPTVRERYFERIQLTNEELVEILLLDGCFLLELFTKWANHEIDPVLNTGWKSSDLLSDLIMFENQIPYCVIEKLYMIHTRDYHEIHLDCNTATSPKKKLSLNQLIYAFLSNMEQTKTIDLTQYEAIGDGILHLLHIYHNFFVPRQRATVIHLKETDETECDEFSLLISEKFSKMRESIKKILPTNLISNVEEPLLKKHNSPKKQSIKPISTTNILKNKPFPKLIPCAEALLCYYNIRCEKRRNPKSFLDVSFDDYALSIPYTEIDEHKKVKYVNLLAFEQSRAKEDKHLTSYLWFMSCLIKTTEDVRKLQMEGILDNCLASDEEVVQFFGQLRAACHLDFGKHYLAGIFKRVAKWVDSSWSN